MIAITTTFAQSLAALRAHPAVSSRDIQACLKSTGAFAFTEQVHNTMVQYSIDPLEVFALPQKAVKRAIQFAHAVRIGDYKNVDATTACGLYALKLAPEQSFDYDTLHFLIAGVARVDGAGGDTKGVQRSKLARLFSRVGVNTVSTQKSRSFGDNGFCQALGITFAPTRTQNRTVTLNENHPLVIEFCAMIDRATTAQLDTIAGKGGDE
jgi:predicted ThiF/HesA family dinucleotide-utilizing enzyme